MTVEDRDKLETMSGWMAHASLIAMVAIPLGYLMTWFNVFEAHEVMGIHGSDTFIQSSQTDTLKRLVGFALSMTPQLAILYGLVQLRHLFSAIKGGQVFGEATASKMRSFTHALLAYAALDFVISIPLSAWVTFDNPPGERMIQISIGEGHLQTWFLIALFFAFTRIMVEGMRLQRENADFV